MPNQTYQAKPKEANLLNSTKPNISNEIYLLNKTYKTKPYKANLPHQTKQTKLSTKPNLTYQTFQKQQNKNTKIKFMSQTGKTQTKLANQRKQ